MFGFDRARRYGISSLRPLLRLLGPLPDNCGLTYMDKVSERLELLRLMCVINIPNDFPVYEVRHGVFGNLE